MFFCVHAKALAEEVRGLAARLKELKAGCPAQGCSAGTEGALGALWRRWWLLQHGVSLLQAHAEQKKEEWRDIGISVSQLRSFESLFFFNVCMS